MKNLRLVGLALLLLLSIGLLAACGASEDSDAKENESESAEDTESEEETESGAELSGSVDIDGSSTVYPIMEGITFEYNKVQPNVAIVLNTSGSGGGFKKSTVGEIDFSNASRPIKEEEIAIAEENGVDLYEIQLAYDGLSVVVSQENDFLENITTDELKQIFLADSGKTMWSEVNSEWPEEAINIFSPGHDSGTFDYFNEVILEENPMREGEGVTLSEDDNTLVTGIVNDPNAIGFFGYAYYIENADTLKVLGIDNGDGNPIKPDGDTIQDGSYSPLSRPLFTYVNTAKLKEKPEVLDFATYMLENAASAAEQVGYVALPEEKYTTQIEEITALAGN